MVHQIVRPSGVERETLWVGLAAGVILCAAVVTVTLRAAVPEMVALAAHQVDSRSGLTPAEQGLYADLLVAAQDIAAAPAVSSVSDLAAEGLPPFVRDASWRARGAHEWSGWSGEHGEAFYLGQPGDPALAGTLLLRIAGGEGVVWLKPGVGRPPAHPDAGALAAAGWKQVVFSFNAGVTR